jgi:DNA integrity scanning protein DisA with diadenylate cyclase activity
MTNLYKLIMDSRHNPLRNIPDMNTRHMIMQVLAWMWCIIFSMYLGSIVAFGISAVIHALLIAGVFITAGVFETAKRRPQYFGGLGRGNGGEHE